MRVSIPVTAVVVQAEERSVVGGPTVPCRVVKRAVQKAVAGKAAALPRSDLSVFFPVLFHSPLYAMDSRRRPGHTMM